MRRIISLIFIVVTVFSFNAFGWERLYIVKKGDTLWSISQRFYKNPFLWGKLWYNNTYINNPNLIFPGEILLVGKHGLELYSLRKKEIMESHYNKFRHLNVKRYVSAVWFSKNRFYSICGVHVCVWKKGQFEIAHLRFDTYSNIAVVSGSTVYLLTNKDKLPPLLYVYRKNMDLSHYNHDFYPVYLPIAEIKVLGKIKDGVFKAKIVNAKGSVSSSDVVSAVYPFIDVVGKPKMAKVGDIEVEEILATSNEFQNSIGTFIFFKAKKRFPLIVGKEVELARINKDAFEPINIGRGIVVSQYDNYVGIFFPAVNGLREFPDRTQQYVLR